MNESDPLEGLLVDGTALARDDLAAALRPFVQFDRAGSVWLLDEFEGLPARLKVSCLLLAVKAQYMLEIRQSDAATAQELAELGAMSSGTVRPMLSKLSKAREVAKVEGGYVVPDGAARRVVRQLAEAQS